MTHYVKISGKLIHFIFVVALGQKQKSPCQAVVIFYDTGHLIMKIH